jgi:N-acetylglucosaminyldiphosphoundecaprenol N-acetyl-beta-D-mannosaminyltransferase
VVKVKAKQLPDSQSLPEPVGWAGEVPQPDVASPAAAVTSEPPEYRVLGTRIHAVQIPDATRIIERWIAERGRSHTVAAANVHMMVTAKRDALFRAGLNGSDLVAPDGMPLVWLGRRNGFKLKRRCYGPDLMLEFCQTTHSRGYRHFFYGGAPGVADELASKLKARFPGMVIAGTYSPPFRTLSSQEDEDTVRLINQSRADVLWVGLGCPKQEWWMFEHHERLEIPAVLGVGQAFDIHTGRAHQAPRWMQNHGLEWLFRLVSDPRRLWRRYVIYNTEFIACLALQRLGLKRFD